MGIEYSIFALEDWRKDSIWPLTLTFLVLIISSMARPVRRVRTSNEIIIAEAFN